LNSLLHFTLVRALVKDAAGLQAAGPGGVLQTSRLNGACENALAVDLIDMCRLECSVAEALEEESMPIMAVPVPPSRLVIPSNVFVISSDDGGNHGDQNHGELYDNCQ